MTVREASVKLHVSTGTVYDLIEAGVLPARRLGLKGRKIYLDEADIDKYWESTRTVGKQAVNSFGLKYLTLPGE